MSKDYYATLGVAKGADADTIKKAYRKLAIKHHPDKNAGDKQAEEKFKEITEAYAVLSDTEKRQQYDQYGDSGFHQRYSQEDIYRNFNANDMFRDFGFESDDIFSRLFGGAGGRNGFSGGRPQPAKGQDYVMQLSIPFRLAVEGGKKRVEYRGEQGLENLQVTIPAGIESGQKLRVPGKGGRSPSGGPAGNLFLEITVASDPTFTREDRNLLVKVRIPFSGACLGSSVEVPTLQGNKRIKVPAGIQNGAKIRLKGYGVPAKKGQAAGDLYAIIEVEVPNQLNVEQKALLKELKKAGL
ncbi:MAG: integrase [Desulfuromonadales bacterium C00003094]|jgi:curved DNA-binding protein|nr:MAG: integrase [Desulfuromonadales bacterium C00003094]OEU74533.1 MAG: integrase [Desulfuromonadales bacterium C00003107]